MNNPTTLPKLNGMCAPKLFFVGIGGIGMSGLAQLLKKEGYDVAGSDRAYDAPEKAELYDALRKMGIAIYPQDGSGPKTFQPDMLIASTAVEKGNPDFQENIPVIHRAMALAAALDYFRPHARLITVAGSCGKTSVTGWIADALLQLGEKVLMVNGGYNVRPTQDNAPGNFTCTEGRPDWLVAEVDESDKSLVNFAPDYAVLLNVGNDHYEEDELKRVFTQFLSRAKRGIVIQDQLQQLIPQNTPCKVTCFGTTAKAECIAPANYQCSKEGIAFDTAQFGHVTVERQFGRHSAQNACSVLGLLSQLNLGKTCQELAAAVKPYPGIRQRFEIMGRKLGEVTVINDYAHNPEKLCAAISTAQELYGTPIAAVFQPHGFTPLGFMREALQNELKAVLAPDSLFIMLPVYYAGGTASFTPTSEEVAADLKTAGINAIAATRTETEHILETFKAKAIIVMGARDNSLRLWCKELLK